MHKAAFPACQAFSCIFARFVAVFAESRLPDLIYTARALPLGRDLQAIRLRIVVTLSKNDFPSDFEAFPTRIFKSFLPQFEFTVYRHSFEKGNPVGRKPIFERTLCCNIIIVVRLRNDVRIVRIKCEKRTVLPFVFKAVSHRARQSYHLVRLSPSFRKPYDSFFFCTFSAFFVLSVLLVRSHGFSVCFSAFLCAFLRFSVLSVRSHGVSVCLLSLFPSPIPTTGLKVGVSERRSF